LFSVTAALDTDAEGRYADAVARRDAIRTHGKLRAHPYSRPARRANSSSAPFVKMLRLHDALVDHLAASVRRRHAGPKPSAVLKPSIGESPAAKLRAVP
jgi:hypothetical protein